MWLLLAVAPLGLLGMLVDRLPLWAEAAITVAACLCIAGVVLSRRRAEHAAIEAERRLATIERVIPDLLFETDAHGVITFTNIATAGLLGRQPSALVGMSLRELVDGPLPYLDAALVRGEDPRVIEAAGAVTWDTSWRHASGERVHLSASVTAVREHGALVALRGVVRDQGDRLESERALRESEERFRAALDTARNGIMLVATDGRVLLTNAALRALFGKSAEEMVGTTVADVVPSAQVDQFVALMASRMWSDAVPSQYEFQLRGADGEPLDVELTLSPVREAGRNTGTLIEVHDLTESRRTTEAIRRMADYDRLTGLPNRELFDRHVQRALIDAKYQRRSVAVLLLDIDRFKLINDTLGHTSGDRLLQAVAERLGQHVMPQHILARFGGDEFLLLAPDIGGRAAAEGIARRVSAAFRQPFDHEGHKLKLSVSIGVAVSSGDHGDADYLIRIADAAVHQTKQQGRDGYTIGSEAASDPARLRLELEVDLRSAVDRKEFEVYYQPQLDTQTGTVVGVEALLRWQHPTRGFVPPDEFVPLLEETGLIIEVGEWVLRTGCHEVQRWFTNGGRRVRLAVNLSPRQLLVPNLGEVVRGILEDTGLPPEMLELELTETAAVLDLGSVLGMLHELRDLGVMTAIDDFGVGESWLTRLSDLPVRTLKVDRSFIAGIDSPGNALAIVEAVIALGHALGLLVIAEGVETEGQLAALRAARCDIVQGFYYAQALPGDECARFVEVALAA